MTGRWVSDSCSFWKHISNVFRVLNKLVSSASIENPDVFFGRICHLILPPLREQTLVFARLAPPEAKAEWKDSKRCGNSPPLPFPPLLSVT